MTHYFLLAHNIIYKLSKDFDVPTPILLEAEPSKDHSGCYWDNQIYIGKDTFHNMFHTAILARHEFGHYLEDRFDLSTKERDIKAFEKNTYALGILPKSQKLLTDFFAKR